MIVVGAGPVGSLVARRLSSLGHSVVVLESKERIGEGVCCTGIIGRECWERFPVDSGVILREAKSASLFSPSGNLIRVARDEVQAYIVDRSAFDSALARDARDAGARYLLGCRVTEVTLGGGCVMVRTNRDGRGDDFKARVVVIASGFGSKLPAMLGLGRIDDFVIGTQAEVRADGLGEIEVYTGRGIAPGFFAWFVPTLGDKALAGLLCSHHQGRYLRQFIAELSHQRRITSTEFNITYGGIPLKPLPRTFGERVVVVGDAAGQVKPTTGGGIYYGMLCADIAAEALHRALGEGNLSAGALADYERVWKEKLSRELRVGYWAHKFYHRLSDSQLERIFSIVRSSGMDQALLEDNRFSFDWHADFILGALKHHALRGILSEIKGWRPGRDLSSRLHS